MELFKYKGFISYSHDDERWGSWLHRKIETYRFPRRTVGRETRKGQVPQRYKPVFRDRDELTAGANLGAEIQESLRQSENLIVLCSPRSAQSYWVNEEIIYFKKHNNPDNIFAFIVEGEPFADNEAEECFPHALKYELNKDGTLSENIVEPLAADAREKRDGKHLALLKLLSGLTGLGLDDLVQRDLQRARRRVTGITATALSTVLVMGSLTLYAWNAQEEADTRRADAEGLIEFMLTDLRDRLEPVGKLDIMDAVGREATDYYDSYDDENLGADARGRQAKAYHLLGDIQMRMGNINAAKKYFEPTYEKTREQLDEDPNNSDRIYEHVQSLYWMSVPLKAASQYEEELKLQEEAFLLSQRLLTSEGDTTRALRELAYSQSNLAKTLFNLERYEDAQAYYEASIPSYREVSNRLGTARSQIELANRFGNLSRLQAQQGNHEKALELTLQRNKIVDEQYIEAPDDYFVLSAMLQARSEKGVHLDSLKRYDEARALYIELLKDIDRALLLEPSSDMMKRRRFSALYQIIKLSDQNADDENQELYVSLLETALDERISERAGHAYSRRWDYRYPFATYFLQLRTAINDQDFDELRSLAGRLERFENKLRSFPDKEAEFQKVEFLKCYLKALVNNDARAFEQLYFLSQTIEDKNFVNGYGKYLSVLAIHFDHSSKNNSQISGEVLETSFFQIVEKLYPETAQTIKKQYHLKGVQR